jgi:hypothetical protein
MKSLGVWIAIITGVLVCGHAAYAAPLECPINLPAGLSIRVLPDENLTAGLTTGPMVLTVTSDVRFFPNRPPLLARGSKILGNIVESKQAGHFHGKARLRINLTSILTSDFCEYPIDAKVVEAGKNKVEDDVVFGRGHAKRDVIALLFPPTTIYQLVRIPSRGPKLFVSNETPLTIKLLQSVSLGASSLPQRDEERRTSLLLPENSSVRKSAQDSAAAGPCPAMEVGSPAGPIVQSANVVRPLRNLTPYHVSVYLDRKRVLIMPPCYGPSMIATPTTEFSLEAAASVLLSGGQKQVGLKMQPSAGGYGWDIVPDTGESVAIKAGF